MNDAEWKAMLARMKPAKEKAGFDAWMKKVDAALVKKCGLDNRDLPDWNYLDAFEDGYSPSKAASAAFQAAKEF
jgi:Family of unknown function (DUF5419)